MKLNKVKVNWASVIEPNTKFEPRWEVEAILSPKQAAEFVDLGVKVKEDKETKELSVRFKRKCGGTKKDGTTYTNKPPQVVDGNKQPFTDLIGNGSICNIAYSIRPWTGFGGEGVAADLNAVQVLQHVPYEGDSGISEFDEEGETNTIDEDKQEEDIF